MRERSGTRKRRGEKDGGEKRMYLQQINRTKALSVAAHFVRHGEEIVQIFARELGNLENVSAVERSEEFLVYGLQVESRLGWLARELRGRLKQTKNKLMKAIIRKVEGKGKAAPMTVGRKGRLALLFYKYPSFRSC